MDENKDFTLDLSDKTLAKLEEYAQKTGQTKEEITEYILKEFLHDQLHVFEKIAEQKDKSLYEVLNKQFIKTLESLIIASNVK